MDFADFTLRVCFAPGKDCGIFWREHSVERLFCKCVNFSRPRRRAEAALQLMLLSGTGTRQ